MKIFDAHCDTITKIFDKKENLFENSGHLSLKNLMEFESPVQVFAIWTEPIYYKNALERALAVIDYYYAESKKNEKIFAHANSFDDIIRNQKEGKISGLLAIEGGEPFCGKIEILRDFYRLGVRIISLTWNYRNELAFGVSDSSEKEGITEIGKEFISEAEKLGIILDVSHLSDKSFWDLSEKAKKPFIATHSNARKICPHPRNLTDAQIKEISQRGGLIGLNIYPEFLSEGVSGIFDILNHAKHILDIGGEDILGFGCDFDGIGCLPEGFSDVRDISKVTELFEREFGYALAEKIAYKNFFRIYKNLLK